MSSSNGSARPGLIRQGDVLLVPVSLDAVDELPVQRRGRVVLAHGEATGHAHRVDDPRAELRGDRWTGWYLVVTGEEPVTLLHDEHDPLPVPPGAWEIRRQREYAPQQVRWVVD